MSDSENLDFSPTRKAKIAACEKLRDTVTGISALHKSLLDEILASSPTHTNSFSEIYRMSTQAMAMKKEETGKTDVASSIKVGDLFTNEPLSFNANVATAHLDKCTTCVECELVRCSRRDIAHPQRP
ncbi:hypothetical protein TNIN_27021 [Trichonephila inaurata madagascariensis]|uniref:Uncharacterized protein n=1 Tax=Trichonephila inaurata madagascariensis TaxID=2747483 RepID=A0A8X7C1P3_9ARAC|nr:hypothetical protein TNIN_27021 [Trichonephila inaurata madagascariensis]